MNKWDSRFMALAEFVASWSKDPNTKVGAVIVDRKKRIKSLGFNGFPQGVEDDNRLTDRSTKNDIVVHAEVNAILFSGGALDDCTLYVWPLPPCSRCAAQIVQAGIKRVVAFTPPGLWKLTSSSWKGSCSLGAEMLTEAGVELDYIEEAQGELDFQQMKVEVDTSYKPMSAKEWEKIQAHDKYVRELMGQGVLPPSCFGTPAVLNPQQRAENCCDDCKCDKACVVMLGVNDEKASA